MTDKPREYFAVFDDETNHANQGNHNLRWSHTKQKEPLLGDKDSIGTSSCQEVDSVQREEIILESENCSETLRKSRCSPRNRKLMDSKGTTMGVDEDLSGGDVTYVKRSAEFVDKSNGVNDDRTSDWFNLGEHINRTETTGGINFEYEGQASYLERLRESDLQSTISDKGIADSVEDNLNASNAEGSGSETASDDDDENDDEGDSVSPGNRAKQGTVGSMADEEYVKTMKAQNKAKQKPPITQGRRPSGGAVPPQGRRPSGGAVPPQGRRPSVGAAQGRRLSGGAVGLGSGSPSIIRGRPSMSPVMTQSIIAAARKQSIGAGGGIIRSPSILSSVRRQSIGAGRAPSMIRKQSIIVSRTPSAVGGRRPSNNPPSRQTSVTASTMVKRPSAMGGVAGGGGRGLAIVRGRGIANKQISKAQLQAGAYSAGISTGRCILKTKVGTTAIQVIRTRRQDGSTGLLILQKPLGAKTFAPAGNIAPPNEGETLITALQDHFATMGPEAPTITAEQLNTESLSPPKKDEIEDDDKTTATEIATEKSARKKAKEPTTTSPRLDVDAKSVSESQRSGVKPTSVSQRLDSRPTSPSASISIMPTLLGSTMQVGREPKNEYTDLLKKEEDLHLSPEERKLTLSEINKKYKAEDPDARTVEEELGLSESEMDLNIKQFNDKRGMTFLLKEMKILQDRCKLSPIEMRMNLGTIDKKRAEANPKARSLKKTLALRDSELRLAPEEMIRKRFEKIRKKNDELTLKRENIDNPQILELLQNESLLKFSDREKDMPLDEVDESRRKKDSNAKSIISELELSPSEEKMTLPEFNEKRCREVEQKRKANKPEINLPEPQSDDKKSGILGYLGSAIFGSSAKVSEVDACSKAYSQVLDKKSELQLSPSERLQPLSQVEKSRSKQNISAKSKISDIHLKASEVNLNYEQLKEKRSQDLRNAKVEALQTDFGLKPSDMNMTMSQIDKKSSKSVIARLSVTKSEEKLSPSELFKKRIEDDPNCATNDMKNFVAKVSNLKFSTKEKSETLSRVDLSRRQINPNSKSIKTELELTTSEMKLNLMQLNDKRAKESEKLRSKLQDEKSLAAEIDLQQKTSSFLDFIPSMFGAAPKVSVAEKAEKDYINLIEEEEKLQIVPANRNQTLAEIDKDRSKQDSTLKSLKEELNLTTSELQLNFSQLNEQRSKDLQKEQLIKWKNDLNFADYDINTRLSEIDKKQALKDPSKSAKDMLNLSSSEERLTPLELFRKRFRENPKYILKPQRSQVSNDEAELLKLLCKEVNLNMSPQETFQKLGQVESNRMQKNPNGESMKKALGLTPCEMNMNLPELNNKRFNEHIQRKLRGIQKEFDLLPEDMDLTLPELDAKLRKRDPKCALLKDVYQVQSNEKDSTLSDLFTGRVEDIFGLPLKPPKPAMELPQFLSKQANLNLTPTEKTLTMSEVDKIRLKKNPESKSVKKELKLSDSEMDLNLQELIDTRCNDHLQDQLKMWQDDFNLESPDFNLPLDQLDSKRQKVNPKCKTLRRELSLRQSDFNLTVQELNQKKMKESFGIFSKDGQFIPPLDISDYLAKVSKFKFSPNERALSISQVDQNRLKDNPTSQSIESELQITPSEKHLKLSQLNDKRYKQHLQLKLKDMQKQFSLTGSELNIPLEDLDERLQKDPKRKPLKNKLRLESSEMNLTLPQLNEKRFKDEFEVKLNPAMDILEYIDKLSELKFTPKERTLTMYEVEQNRFKQNSKSMSVKAQLRLTPSEMNMNLAQLNDKRCNEHLHAELETMKDDFGLTNDDTKITVAKLCAKRTKLDPNCKSLKDELHLTTSDMNLTLKEVNMKHIEEYGVTFQDGKFKIPMDISEYIEKCENFDLSPAEKNMTIPQIDIARSKNNPQSKSILKELQISPKEQGLNLEQLCDKRYKEHLQSKVRKIQRDFGLSPTDMNITSTQLDVKRRGKDVNCKTLKTELEITKSEANLTVPQLMEKRLQDEHHVTLNTSISQDISELVSREADLSFTRKEKDMTLAQLEQSRHKIDPSKSLISQLQVTSSEMSLNLSKFNNKRCIEKLSSQLKSQQDHFKLANADLSSTVSQLDAKRRKLDPKCQLIKDELYLDPSEIKLTLPEINQKRLQEESGLTLKEGKFVGPILLSESLAKEKELKFTPEEKKMKLYQINERRINNNPKSSPITKELQLSLSEKTLTLSQLNNKRLNENLQTQLKKMQHDFHLSPSDLNIPITELDVERKAQSPNCKSIKDELRIQPSEKNLSLKKLNEKRFQDKYGLTLVPDENILDLLSKEAELCLTPEEKGMTMTTLDKSIRKRNPLKSLKSELQLMPSEMGLNLTELNDKRCKDYLESELKTMQSNLRLTKNDMNVPVSQLDTKRQKSNMNCQLLKDQLNLTPAEVGLTIPEIKQKRLQEESGVRLKDGKFTGPLDIEEYIEKQKLLKFAPDETNLPLSLVNRNRQKDAHPEQVVTTLQLTLSDKELNLTQLDDKRFKKHLQSKLNSLQQEFSLDPDDVYLSTAQLDAKRRAKDPRCKGIKEELNVRPSEINLSLQKLSEKRFEETYGVKLQNPQDISDLITKEAGLSLTLKEKVMTMADLEKSRLKQDPSKSLKSELQLTPSEMNLNVAQLNDKRCKEYLAHEIKTQEDKFSVKGGDLKETALQLDIKRQKADPQCKLIKDSLNLTAAEMNMTLPEINKKRLREQSHVTLTDGKFVAPIDIADYLIKQKNLNFTPDEQRMSLSQFEKNRSKKDPKSKTVTEELQLTPSERDMNMNLSQLNYKRFKEHMKADLNKLQRDFNLVPTDLHLPISKLDSNRRRKNRTCRAIEDELGVNKSDINLTLPQLSEKRFKDKYGVILQPGFAIPDLLAIEADLRFTPNDTDKTMAQLDDRRSKQDPTSKPLKHELQLTGSEMNLNLSQLNDKRCIEALAGRLKTQQADFSLDNADFNSPVSSLDQIRKKRNPKCKLIEDELNLSSSEMHLSLPEINLKRLQEESGMIFRDGMFHSPMGITQYLAKQKEMKFTTDEKGLTMSHIESNRMAKHPGSKSVSLELQLSESEKDLNISQLDDKRSREYLQAKLKKMQHDLNLGHADLNLSMSQLSSKCLTKSPDCKAIAEKLSVRPSEMNLTLSQFNDKRFQDEYNVALKSDKNISDFFAKQPVLKLTPKEKAMTMAQIDQLRFKHDPSCVSIKTNLQLTSSEMDLNLLDLNDKRCKAYVEEELKNFQDDFGLTVGDINLPISDVDTKRQKLDPTCRLLTDKLNLLPSERNMTLRDVTMKHLQEEDGVTLKDGKFIGPVDISEYLAKEIELKFHHDEKNLPISKVDENRQKKDPKSKSLMTELKVSPSEKELTLTQLNDKRLKEAIQCKLKKMQRELHLTASDLNLNLPQLEQKRHIKDPHCKDLKTEIHVKPSEEKLTLAQINEKRFEVKFGVSVIREIMDFAEFLRKRSELSFAPHESTLTLGEINRLRGKEHPSSKSVMSELKATPSEMLLNLSQLEERRSIGHVQAQINQTKDQFKMTPSDMDLPFCDFHKGLKPVIASLDVKPSEMDLNLSELHLKRFKVEHGASLRPETLQVTVDSTDSKDTVYTQLLTKESALKFTAKEKTMTIEEIERHRIKSDPDSKSVISTLRVRPSETAMSLSEFNEKRCDECVKVMSRELKYELKLTTSELRMPLKDICAKQRSIDPIHSTVKEELTLTDEEENFTLPEVIKSRIQNEWKKKKALQTTALFATTEGLLSPGLPSVLVTTPSKALFDLNREFEVVKSKETGGAKSGFFSWLFGGSKADESQQEISSSTSRALTPETRSGQVVRVVFSPFRMLRRCIPASCMNIYVGIVISLIIVTLVLIQIYYMFLNKQ